MDDKISFTVKLMLLMTIKTARLQPPGGMRNDSWRVPVGFLTSSNHKGVGNSTMNAQLRVWEAAGACKCLNRCNFGQHVFSC